MSLWILMNNWLYEYRTRIMSTEFARAFTRTRWMLYDQTKWSYNKDTQLTRFLTRSFSVKSIFRTYLKFDFIDFHKWLHNQVLALAWSKRWDKKAILEWGKRSEDTDGLNKTIPLSWLNDSLCIFKIKCKKLMSQ